jgi:hypothetical protein
VAPKERARLDGVAARAALALAPSGVEWSPARAASLRTLVASVLAPAAARPPHLGLAVALLAAAAAGDGTADVRSTARTGAAALEGLLHPRAVPVVGGGRPDGGAVELAELDWGVPPERRSPSPSPPPSPPAAPDVAATAPAAAPAPPAKQASPLIAAARRSSPPPAPPAAALAAAPPPAAADESDDDLPSLDSGSE